MDTLVDSFFAIPVPPNARNEGDNPRASSPLASLRSLTSTSAHIIVPTSGVIELSLGDFCDYVDEYALLKEAVVVSVEGYRQRVGIVQHRFVVIELSNNSQRNVWLRLDRRVERGISLLRFVRASGETNANDRVSLSGTKHKLILTSTFENSRILEDPPCVADLIRLLRIICEELQIYRIWPENCWFFCSLIQQHLAASTDGWFSHSTHNVKHIEMGNAIRSNVFARYWGGGHPAIIRAKVPHVTSSPSPQPTRGIEYRQRQSVDSHLYPVSSHTLNYNTADNREREIERERGRSLIRDRSRSQSMSRSYSRASSGYDPNHSPSPSPSWSRGVSTDSVKRSSWAARLRGKSPAKGILKDTKRGRSKSPYRVPFDSDVDEEEDSRTPLRTRTLSNTSANSASHSTAIVPTAASKSPSSNAAPAPATYQPVYAHSSSASVPRRAATMIEKGPIVPASSSSKRSKENEKDLPVSVKARASAAHSTSASSSAPKKASKGVDVHAAPRPLHWSIGTPASFARRSSPSAR
ncbi:hypothetical protein DL93DRAFT_289270 [Clavulina sp. PMI_390]|nr:hypothetical protein DL93DRAFT_289270 [Clavulina sp. PMI_390]